MERAANPANSTTTITTALAAAIDTWRTVVLLMSSGRKGVLELLTFTGERGRVALVTNSATILEQIIFRGEQDQRVDLYFSRPSALNII